MLDAYDADGSDFDLNPALNCPRGVLVYARPNETRDMNCNLVNFAGLKQVCSEPVIVKLIKMETMVSGQIGELKLSGNLKKKRFFCRYPQC